MLHSFWPSVAIVLVALLVGIGPVVAQPAVPLASADTNTSGVTADVVECKRKEGVLTIKILLRNTGAADVRLDLIRSRNYDEYYLTAGSKKYFILRDTEKTPLAAAADSGGSLVARIPANGTYTWWARYPAPPAEVKAVTVYTPIAPPIDDVPITDP